MSIGCSFKVYGYNVIFSAIFTEGDNFYDFLFAPLAHKILREVKVKTGRVVSPESVLIHLKYCIYQAI